jgi:hypothetical protein
LFFREKPLSGAGNTEKDLLQLLALQQELGQIDEQVLGTWEEDTLKTYNRVLKAHVEELQHQVKEIQARASACVGVPTFFTPTRRDFVRVISVSRPCRFIWVFGDLPGW